MSGDENESNSTSWLERFYEFQDEQRIERLQQQCPRLEALLKNCRETGKSSSEKLEERGLALRNIKFFDWRGIAQKHPEIEDNCSREEHLVWACRSVTIGCGNELSALKDCFQREGAYKVLTSQSTAYEGETPLSVDNQSKKTSTTHPQIPCREFQETLGTCVTTGAHELYKRRKRRQGNSTTNSTTT